MRTVHWLGQTWRVEDRRASSAPHLLLHNESGQVSVLPTSEAFEPLVEILKGETA